MDYNLLNSPWAITPEALQTVAQFDIGRLEDPVELFKAKAKEKAEGDSAKTHSEWKEEFMRQFEEKLMVSEDGVAQIEISGPLMPNPGPVDRYYFDAADSVRIAHLIRAAANSPDIHSLVMMINSPGGMVIGTPEMGDAVRAFNDAGKTSYAFADTLMASAAYWVGSQASKVYVTDSAMVGSIGVIRPHFDLSKMHDKMGVKVEVFRGGSHKVSGAYGTALTDDQREHIQDGVNAAHEDFISAVNNLRTISREHCQGQVFYGKDAVGVGIVDRTIPNSLALMQAAHTSVELHKEEQASVDTERQTTMDKELPTDKADLEKDDAELDSAEDRDKNLDTPEGDVEKISELEGQVASLTEDRDSANAKAEEAQSKLETLTAEHEDLKASFDEKVDAKAKELAEDLANEKAEALAEEKAAKIAAESGTDPADIADTGDSSPNQSGKSESELWDEYAEIRKEKGDTAARAFYVEHIEGKF